MKMNETFREVLHFSLSFFTTFHQIKSQKGSVTRQDW